MTLATRITIIRILLIPVFVAFVAYYGESISEGSPDARLRRAAILNFIPAALSDALAGWLARRFNQKSRLGAILDPIADKGLMLAAILALTLSGWPVGLPIWFTVLIITKETITVGGAFLLHHLAGGIEIHPHFIGKTCTFLQMFTVSWIMVVELLPRGIDPAGIASFLIFATAITAIIATAIYILAGVRQVGRSES